MLNLNSNIDLNFKKFFRWWSRELEFLVPERLKSLIVDKSGVIFVKLRDNRLELVYQSEAAVEQLAIVDRNEDGFAQIRDKLAAEERLAKAAVVIRLNRVEGIQKLLLLPTAAKENLQQVVAYELSKYTPFSPEQVYFAVKPVNNSDNEPGQIKALLILAPKENVDVIVEDVKALGLFPTCVDYEGAPNDIDDRFDQYNLLPEWQRPKADRMLKLVYSGLATAVVLLLAAVIGMPVWYEYQAVELIREKIQSIEKGARNIKQLQSEIDNVIAETRSIVEMKKSVPPVLEIFNKLSTLIKDDTWLFYAQYADGHLQIQGESPSASGLIAVLEDSELFTNAKFASPVTQDTTTGFERFQITADVTQPGGKRD